MPEFSGKTCFIIKASQGWQHTWMQNLLLQINSSPTQKFASITVHVSSVLSALERMKSTRTVIKRVGTGTFQAFVAVSQAMLASRISGAAPVDSALSPQQ